MHHPWIQVSQDEHIVLDYSPFRAFQKQLYAKEQPSMISVIGNLSKLIAAESIINNKNILYYGARIDLISNNPFLTYYNQVYLEDDIENSTPDFRYVNKYELQQQTASGFIMRLSHLMSDIIMFIASDVDEAAKYLSRWVEECRKTNFQDQPIALVVLTSTYYCSNTDKSVPQEFLRACRKISACHGYTASEFKDMRERVFRHVEVVRHFTPLNSLPDGILNELIISREYRSARGHLWSSGVFLSIAEGGAASLAGELCNHKNYVEILDSRRLHPVVPVQTWIIEQWSAWFEADFSNSLYNFQIPIIASCLARDSLRLGHIFKSHETFDSLYQKPLNMALLSQKHVDIPKFIEKLRNLTSTKISDYVSGKICLKNSLKEYKDFFARIPCQKICFGCFLAPNQVHFDCGCALCESCCQGFTSPSSNSSLFRFNSCPLCYKDIIPHQIRIPEVSTFGYRILALDPGGVKGIVQLELLSAIEKQLGLPLQLFFDLIIGTSIGGINALALGLLQWPIDKCKTTLMALSRDVFQKKHSWWWLGNWSTKIYSIFRAIVYDGVYEIEGALRQTFGNGPMIGSRQALYNGVIQEHIKVAVVTTEGQSSKSHLLTTYNKVDHPIEPSYGWVQDSQSTIVESAYATAAAPFFFPAKALGSSGEIYQDGLYIPLPQARSEGLKLWPYKQDPDYILSVGCGILQSINTSKRSWVYRVIHSANTALNGHVQYENFRLANDSKTTVACERIDTTLEMDEVNLNDVASMKKMQHQVREKLLFNKELRSQVRQIAFKMTGALFFFEFSHMPRFQSNMLYCFGSIHCRYRDDIQIMKALKGQLNRSIRISVRGRYYPFKDWKGISFELLSWNDIFDIRLEEEGCSTSISGFPDSASNIINFQLSTGQSLFIDDANISKKRKFEQE